MQFEDLGIKLLIYFNELHKDLNFAFIFVRVEVFWRKLLLSIFFGKIFVAIWRNINLSWRFSPNLFSLLDLWSCFNINFKENLVYLMKNLFIFTHLIKNFHFLWKILKFDIIWHRYFIHWWSSIWTIIIRLFFNTIIFELIFHTIKFIINILIDLFSTAIR